eukprot:CAMPEP_0119052094 /NCGR_PEP_ID=MMETSP1177-20130426/73508_1 /TAXON_ID=2985 /ORGANISM="Ochromonas sp, Strain CCMP1899" /LENGTH=1020 /DNA_ID=CAMNT_0007031547 /DNA_START=106 /DNA_END=3165 /DNA_ORIENTATION=-
MDYHNCPVQCQHRDPKDNPHSNPHYMDNADGDFGGSRRHGGDQSNGQRLDDYQESSDFYAKDEYFQNECEDVKGWGGGSGSVSKEPGTDSAIDALDSRGSSTNNTSESSDNDRSRSSSDMSNSTSTTPRAPFDQHMYGHDSSFRSPQRLDMNSTTPRSPFEQHIYAHDPSSRSSHGLRHNHPNYNEDCHGQDSHQRKEAIAEVQRIPYSDDNTEASFLKAFFSHSFCLYMGPRAFLRSDLRDSPMQYFPFKSRSASRESDGARSIVDNRGINSDNAEMKCKSSACNLLEGDINSMWIGLTQAISIPDLLATPVPQQVRSKRPISTPIRPTPSLNPTPLSTGPQVSTRDHTRPVSTPMRHTAASLSPSVSLVTTPSRPVSIPMRHTAASLSPSPPQASTPNRPMSIPTRHTPSSNPPQMSKNSSIKYDKKFSDVSDSVVESTPVVTNTTHTCHTLPVSSPSYSPSFSSSSTPVNAPMSPTLELTNTTHACHTSPVSSPPSFPPPTSSSSSTHINAPTPVVTNTAHTCHTSPVSSPSSSSTRVNAPMSPTNLDSNPNRLGESPVSSPSPSSTRVFAPMPSPHTIVPVPYTTNTSSCSSSGTHPHESGLGLELGSSTSSSSSSSSGSSNLKGRKVKESLIESGFSNAKYDNQDSIKDPNAKDDNYLSNNRYQSDASIEKMSVVEGIGIKNENNGSKSRIKLPNRELLDGFISDRHHKCSNVSHEKYMLQLKNRISHSLKKNKFILRISVVFASFLVAYIAINVSQNYWTIQETKVCPSESSTMSAEFLPEKSFLSPPDVMVDSDSSLKLPLSATVHWVRAGASMSLGFNDVNSNGYIGEKKSHSQGNLHDYFHCNISHAKRSPSPELGDIDEEGPYTPLPLYQYQWRKNGLNITNFSEGHKFFTIKKFKSCDEGVYQYIATVHYPNQASSQGTKDLILSETVLGMSSKPFSKSKASYVELPVDSVLFIQLVAEGSPTPSYQWFRNGVPLYGEIKSSVYAKNVDSSYSGTYSCELQNVAGKYVW